MDRAKAMLEEMDQKAAVSSNAYELIMNLMSEARTKMQAYHRGGRLSTSGLIHRHKDSRDS